MVNVRNVVQSAFVIALMALSGCAAWQPGVGLEYIDAKRGFTLMQPEGWYRSPYRARGYLTYTKDGPDLQYIIVGRKTHKNAFREIDRESSKDDFPQSLAENYIANIKASLGLDLIQIVENVPAQVGGVPGFKLVMEYKTDAGLRYRELVYAAATEDGLYSIEYRAPVLHYYDRDVAEFESIKDSFVISSIASIKK